ncbi:MAG: phospho-N-acetylmuramoyl-pentapeptide-transferase [Calditrichaeota bacterium]|nr:phospho-N-acetylmuramoyl-pentapeptide-transferase [Calditrichota bacterium]
MFYHLLYPLRDAVSGFNVFRYITFRAGGAAVTALLISFIIGPIIIRKMRKGGITEEIRSDGPDTHQAKAGTPTMGGLIILPAILTGTLLFSRLDHPHIWVLVLATVWMGVVGFIDDWLKNHRDKKGLIPRYKLTGQILLGVLIGSVLYFSPEMFSTQFADFKTLSTLPFFKNKFLEFAPFGFWPLYIIMVVIVITATSNGVNLTDGQDGLAIGVVGIMATGFAILAYISGHVVFSDYLNIIFLPGSGEIAVYCAAIIGAALGFLWFNAYPAQIFMGDTGALALGSGMACCAILIKKELFLLMLGGVLVVEALSVIIQRYYFKYTRMRSGVGARIFLMAPIHHHFELKGWPESRVVVRIWIIGILLLFLTMTSFKVR